MDFTLENDIYIAVRFDQIEGFLGREHMGTGEDDERIIEELLRLGAPDWIKTNEGFLDRDGKHGWWYIKGPAYS